MTRQREGLTSTPCVAVRWPSVSLLIVFKYCTLFLISANLLCTRQVAVAASLNVLAFGFFSHETENGLQWFTEGTRSISAIFPLAIKHFNERDGSIIPDFATQTCSNLSINLVAYEDDRGSPSKAMNLLVSRRNLDNIHAVLGPVRSVVAQPLAATLSALHIPLVSHWATSPLLSNQQTYEFFSRLCPADDAMALVTAGLFQKLGFQRAGMLFVNDNFGQSWKNALLAACERLGIHLIYAAFDDAAGRDLEKDALTIIKQNKINAVFFVYGLQPAALFHLAKAAEALGMLSDKHIFLHTINHLDFADMAFPQAVPLIREFLRGSIAIQDGVPGLSAESSGSLSEPFERFYRMWPTFRESDVNRFFPNHTDVVDGTRFQFPPGYFASTASHIINAFLWAYDAVATLGLAACALQNRSGPDALSDGYSLLQAVRSTSFNGLSGHVRFSNGTGDRDPLTNIYVARNVHWNSSDGTVAYRTIGQFSPSTNEWTVRLAEAVFRDGTSTVPSDVDIPDHDEQLLPSWARVLGYFETSFGLALGLFGLVWLRASRRHVSVVQSQPVFMAIITLGILFISVSIIPLTIEGDTKDCMAFPFLYSIGIMLACSSISAKNLRVGVLWYRLRDRKQDRGFVYLSLIFFMVIINFILLVTWTYVAPLEYRRFIVSSDVNGQPVKSYGACAIVKNETYVFLGLVLGHLAIVLIWTGLVSVWVHHAPEQFQDSKWTALGACSLGQVYLLGIPIVVIIYNSPTPRFVALSSICFLTALILFFTMLGPKIVFSLRNPGLKIASSGQRQQQQEQPQNKRLPSPLLNKNSGKPGAIRLRFSPIPSSSAKKRLPKRNTSPALPPQLPNLEPIIRNEPAVTSPKAKAHRSDFHIDHGEQLGERELVANKDAIDQGMIPTTLSGDSEISQRSPPDHLFPAGSDLLDSWSELQPAVREELPRTEGGDQSNEQTRPVAEYPDDLVLV